MKGRVSGKGKETAWSGPFIFALISILICSCSKIDEKKFTGVSRAAKTIEGACAVGVNYHKFIELLQGLSGEVNILKDQAKSEKEKELTALYFKILTIYKDSADLWKRKMDGLRYGFVPEDKILVGPDIEPIIKRYRLKKSEFMVAGSTLENIPEESIQIVWKVASKYIQKADDFTAGRASTTKTEDDYY